MAITIRPTDDEVKLVEYAKGITGEKTASKALLKLCLLHQDLSKKHEKLIDSERSYRTRTNKAESTIRNFQQALSSMTKYEP